MYLFHFSSVAVSSCSPNFSPILHSISFLLLVPYLFLISSASSFIYSLTHPLPISSIKFYFSFSLNLFVYLRFVLSVELPTCCSWISFLHSFLFKIYLIFPLFINSYIEIINSDSNSSHFRSFFSFHFVIFILFYLSTLPMLSFLFSFYRALHGCHPAPQN